MNTPSSPRQTGRLLAALLMGAVLLACAGCQTFSLTEEEFRRQQRGEMVDRETGEIVGAAGTLGYLGAVVGVAAAEAIGK